MMVGSNQGLIFEPYGFDLGPGHIGYRWEFALEAARVRKQPTRWVAVILLPF